MINYGFNIDVTGNALKSLEQLNTFAQKLTANFQILNKNANVNVTGNALSSLNKISDSAVKLNSDFKTLKTNSNINVTGNGLSAINNLNNSAKNTTSSIISLKNALLGLGAVNLSKNIFEKGLFFERSKIGFEKLAETPEEGRKFYEDLVNFAKTTPVTFEEAVKGGSVLLGVGLKTDEALRDLERISTVAKTLGSNLNYVLYNYAQGFTKKNVDARDIREYGTHRIPMLQVLTDMFKDTKQFKELGGISEMVSKGLIGSEAIREAFRRMTDEGGRFHGMFKELMERTPGGKLSLLQSELQLAGQKLFEKSAPYLIKFMEYMTKLIGEFPRLEGAFERLFKKLDMSESWWYKSIASLLGFNKELGSSGDIIDKISNALDILGSVLSAYMKWILPFQVFSSVLGGISGIVTGLIGISGFGGLSVSIGGAGIAATGLLASLKSMNFLVPILAANMASLIHLYNEFTGENHVEDTIEEDLWRGLKNIGSGAVLGATVGSIIPGVGTMTGGIIGATAGLGVATARIISKAVAIPITGEYQSIIPPIKQGVSLLPLPPKEIGSHIVNPFKKQESIKAEDLLLKGKESEDGGLGGRSGIGGKVRDFIININSPIVKIDKIVSEEAGKTGVDIAKIAADQFASFLTEVQLSTQ